MCECAIRTGALQAEPSVNAKYLATYHYNTVSYCWTSVLYVLCWYEIINLIYTINEITLGPNEGPEEKHWN